MQLQSDCTLTEAKSWGGRQTFATEKSILFSTLFSLIGRLRQNLQTLNGRFMKEAVDAYAELKGQFSEAMFGAFESFRRGEITLDVLEGMWKAEIGNAWGKAYEYGVRSVGNPFGVWEQDKNWLKGAKSEEAGYLKKFVDDIRQNELGMSVENRLKLYVETLDGVYNHGKVEASPEYVKIYWLLREAKHCDSCIAFAAGSPYTKKTLPAVPRDGTSRCLSNCRCELRFEYEGQKEQPKSYFIKGPLKPSIPAGYRSPTDIERDKLGRMYAEIERLRALIDVSSGAAKKELIFQRRDLNKEMIDFMELHRIHWVPGTPTRRTLFTEEIASEVKDVLLEGGAGSGHWGHKGRPGLRGGSLPSGAGGGAAISAKKETGTGGKLSSSEMGRKLTSVGKGGMTFQTAMTTLQKNFPGYPDAKYARAIMKSGVVGKATSAPTHATMSVEEIDKHFEANNVEIMGSAADTKKFMALMTTLPRHLIESSSVKNIELAPTMAGMLNEYGERTGDRNAYGVDAFYDRDDHTMVVCLQSTEAKFSILHEFGHSLYKLEKAWGPKIHYYAGKKGDLTPYAEDAKDPRESWAECFAMYFTNPAGLKKKSKKAFSLIEEAVRA